MSVISSIASRIFSWFKGPEETSNPTRTSPHRPAARDWTDALTVNAALTKALYHNSYPGMKLAGGLAFAPIAVPVWFMGLPVPEPVDPEDEDTKETLRMILDSFAKDIKQIHIQSHREGTCWIWPHYSAASRELVWEFIPDETICDIFRDLSTGRITKIITDEEIKIGVAENQTATVRRKRIFTETTVVETFVVGGMLDASTIRNRSMRNVSRILPIPFANNSDGDEVRGHSDYERIITDLKDYHDIDLRISTYLTKFNIKMIQEVQSVDAWMKANEITDLEHLDIEHIDLIFNLKDKESTHFEWPQSAFEAGERRLSTKFWKIVEESMIPELCWGIKVEGNMASADRQIEGLVMYVQDKRNQHTESYKKLFQASLALLNTATMEDEPPPVKITWNKLDAISEISKATIFQSLASGIASILSVAGMTKENLYNILKEKYPTAVKETLEEFILGLSDMAQFKQYMGAQYVDVYDMQNRIKPTDGTPPMKSPVDDAPPADTPAFLDKQRQIDGPSSQTS